MKMNNRFWSWYDLLYSVLGLSGIFFYWLFFNRDIYMIIPFGIVLFVTVVNIIYYLTLGKDSFTFKKELKK